MAICLKVMTMRGLDFTVLRLKYILEITYF